MRGRNHIMNKSKIGEKKDPLSLLASIYFVLMIAGFPLFYTNNYINIIQSKKAFFELTSVACIVYMCVIIIFKMTNVRIQQIIADRISKGHIICLFLLVIGLLLSTLSSDNILNSVFAPDGRRYGLFVMLFAIFGYLFVALFFEPGIWTIKVIAIINSFMSVLIIADNWKIDILNMKENLVEYQYSKFTGTMGNININASYFSIIVPFLIGTYYVINIGKKGQFTKIVLSISMFLSLCVSICLRSDSIIWCVFLVIMIVWYHCLVHANTREAYKKVCVIMGVWAMSYSFIGLLYKVFNSSSYPFSITGELFCQGYGLLVIWMFFVLSIILMFIKTKNDNFDLKTIARIILLLSCFAVGIVIICIIYANVLTYGLKDGFFSRFIVDDSFGNNRGYVWKRTITMIKKEGLVKFICGHGLNRFYVPFNKYFYDEMMQRFSVPYIDAHNEILQMTVAIGAIGMTGYVGMMITSIAEGIKGFGKSPFFVIKVVVFTSYILQGMVNNPQIFTLPLIFIFMGLLDKNKIEIICE